MDTVAILEMGKQLDIAEKRKSGNRLRIPKNIAQTFINQHRWVVDKEDEQAQMTKKEVIRKSRMERMKFFKENLKIVLKQSFASAFTKKWQEIVKYLVACTVHTGVLKVKASTIAKKKDCSLNTVYNCVKQLKESRQFYIGYEGKGTYVIVDKLHSNYIKAMKEVFGMEKEKAEELRKDLKIGDVAVYDLDEQSPLRQLLEVLVRDNEVDRYIEPEEHERLREVVEMEDKKQQESLTQLYYEEIATEITNEQKRLAYQLIGVKEGQSHPLVPFIDYASEILTGTTSSLLLDCLYDFLSYVGRRSLTGTDNFIMGMALRTAKEHFDEKGVAYSGILLDKFREELEAEYEPIIQGKIESAKQAGVRLEGDEMLANQIAKQPQKKKPKFAYSTNDESKYMRVNLSEYLSGKPIKPLDKFMAKEKASLHTFFDRYDFRMGNGSVTIAETKKKRAIQYAIEFGHNVQQVQEEK